MRCLGANRRARRGANVAARGEGKKEGRAGDVPCSYCTLCDILYTT